jgi:capsule polysaccharide export protein KpsE/RkpR
VIPLFKMDMVSALYQELHKLDTKLEKITAERDEANQKVDMLMSENELLKNELNELKCAVKDTCQDPAKFGPGT